MQTRTTTRAGLISLVSSIRLACLKSPLVGGKAKAELIRLVAGHSGARRAQKYPHRTRQDRSAPAGRDCPRSVVIVTSNASELLCKYLYDYAGIDILPLVTPKKPAALPIKPLEFLGSSRDDLAAMPAGVRHDIGLELMRVQFGGQPTDFKPMSAVGSGAYEIRVRDASGAYRAVHVAKLEATVYVLHAFQKKTQQTSRADIELARARYRMIGAKP